jgi:hypothetical protein
VPVIVNRLFIRPLYRLCKLCHVDTLNVQLSVLVEISTLCFHGCTFITTLRYYKRSAVNSMCVSIVNVKNGSYYTGSLLIFFFICELLSRFHCFCRLLIILTSIMLSRLSLKKVARSLDLHRLHSFTFMLHTARRHEHLLIHQTHTHAVPVLSNTGVIG